jgi:hypothetical protein
MGFHQVLEWSTGRVLRTSTFWAEWGNLREVLVLYEKLCEHTFPSPLSFGWPLSGAAPDILGKKLADLEANRKRIFESCSTVKRMKKAYLMGNSTVQQMR